MTITEVLRQHRLTLPRNGACRLNTTAWSAYDIPPCGEIQGIPSLRGVLLASNGVLGILLRGDGEWALVHKAHFIIDKTERTVLVRPTTTYTKRNILDSFV